MGRDDLKLKLILGDNIPYMGLNITQPTVRVINTMGYSNYMNYVSIFCMRKENLFSEVEYLNKIKNNSFFESLFIYDLDNIESNKSVLLLLKLSLCFFLKINIQDIAIDYQNKILAVLNSNSDIIFELDNSNFEEFSELIRLISNCKLADTKKEEKPKIVSYNDPEIQKIYEDLLKQNQENQVKEEKANEISLADIIKVVCNDYIHSGYNYNTINELTVWQVYDTYKSMSKREEVEFTKTQFCSFKFDFSKNTPNFDWIKPTKIKINDLKILNKISK